MSTYLDNIFSVFWNKEEVWDHIASDQESVQSVIEKFQTHPLFDPIVISKIQLPPKTIGLIQAAVGSSEETIQKTYTKNVEAMFRRFPQELRRNPLETLRVAVNSDDLPLFKEILSSYGDYINEHVGEYSLLDAYTEFAQQGFVGGLAYMDKHYIARGLHQPAYVWAHPCAIAYFLTTIYPQYSENPDFPDWMIPFGIIFSEGNPENQEEIEKNKKLTISVMKKVWDNKLLNAMNWYKVYGERYNYLSNSKEDLFPYLERHWKDLDLSYSGLNSEQLETFAMQCEDAGSSILAIKIREEIEARSLTYPYPLYT